MSIYSPSLESSFTVTCMGKQKSDLRLGLDDRVSFAARHLFAKENPDALSTMTQRFWMPVKVCDDAGKVVDLLINRSSFKKHLTSLGFTKTQIETTMKQKSFDDILQFLAEAELSNKIAAKNPDFTTLAKNAAHLEEMGVPIDEVIQRKNLCHKASVYALSHMSELLRNDFDRIEKVFFEGYNTVVLTSYYDPESNRRVISLNDGVSDIELFSKTMGKDLFEEYTLRKSHFVGLNTIQDDKEHFKLTSKQIDELVIYLLSSDLKYLSDSKVDESKKSTLSERTITYPIELSKKLTQLARTITLISDREILLISSAKSGDKILGKGSFKKVKKATNLISGDTFAVSKKGINRYCPKEIDLKKRLHKSKGIAKILTETPKRVIETRYDGDLRKLSSLSFEEKLALLPKIFEGLKSLHAKGIIHRDIKPENILVRKEASGEYSIDISDLGLAFKKDSGLGLKKVGTRGYMSPEYRQSHPYYLAQLTDESLDIYALGVTLKAIFDLPDVPVSVVRNLEKAFESPAHLPGALATRKFDLATSEFVSAVSHDETLDPITVITSLTPPSSVTSEPGSPSTPPRRSSIDSELSKEDIQCELKKLFDHMTSPQKAHRASWDDISASLGKIGIEMTPPIEKKLRFNEKVDAFLLIEDTGDEEKYHIHSEHHLNPHDRAYRKTQGGYFRRLEGDPYKVVWPTHVDDQVVDTFSMGPSVNLPYLIDILAKDPEKQLNYSQIQYALNNSIFDTILELNPKMIDKKGHLHSRDSKLLNYVSSRASMILTDLLDEASSEGMYYETLDDLRAALIEKAQEKNTTSTKISKETFRDLIKGDGGILQLGEDPESRRIATNIYEAPEFEALLVAYHDGSWREDGFKKITMVEFNEDQMDLLEYVADHVLTHPMFVSFFERFH